MGEKNMLSNCDKGEKMKKFYPLLILSVIFLVVFGVRVYWFTQKNGFHVDEGFSIVFSCFKDQENYELNKKYTGKELKDEGYACAPSIGSALEDVLYLWIDNRDLLHTNFGLSLFRLSLTGLNSSDIKRVTVRGAILNLLLFTVSFIFFFLLMRLLFPESKPLQYLGTACAFLSTASISNTMFFRLYQLQETMFIVFCYCLIRSLDQRKYLMDGGRLYVGKSILFLSLVTAFTLLTGYYAIIFVAFFALYVFGLNYRAKNYTEIKFYVLVFCLGVVFAQFFHLRYLVGYVRYLFGHVSGGSSVQASQASFADVLGFASAVLLIVRDLLQKFFFIYPVVVICGVCLIYVLFRKKKLQIQKPALIFMISLLYVAVIIFVAPFKTLRYVMPVFPFFIFLPAMIINSMGVGRKVSAVIMSLLCFSFLINAANPGKIEHLYRNKPSEYIFSKDADIPVFILTWSPWKNANLIPYFNDEQTYYFIKKYDDILEMGYSEIYIVAENLPRIMSMALPQGEVKEVFAMTGGEPETRAPYFIGAKIKLADNSKHLEHEQEAEK